MSDLSEILDAYNKARFPMTTVLVRLPYQAWSLRQRYGVNAIATKAVGNCGTMYVINMPDMLVYELGPHWLEREVERNPASSYIMYGELGLSLNTTPRHGLITNLT